MAALSNQHDLLLLLCTITRQNPCMFLLFKWTLVRLRLLNVYDFNAVSATRGWLGSRVVSVLDSGAEGPGFKSQSRTVHTVAALLRVEGVTAGLAESNDSLPPGL